MNQFLDDRYAENVQRLSLGLELIDALRQERVGFPLNVEVEQPPKAGPKPAAPHHASCLHALLYYPQLVDRVDIRIFEDFEPDDPEFLKRRKVFNRRYAPRRLRIPLHTSATVDSFPFTDRARRPFIFPGAAYDLDACATGIRGRVLRGGKPMRWARVEAVLPASGQVVGRAHGDDRGEFLLLIGSEAIPVGNLVNPLPLRVRIFGPAAPPAPATPDLPLQDPLWDLPLETVPAPGVADTVSTGETLPAGYTANVTANVDFFLGELRSPPAAFTLV